MPWDESCHPVSYCCVHTHISFSTRLKVVDHNQTPISNVARDHGYCVLVIGTASLVCHLFISSYAVCSAIVMPRAVCSASLWCLISSSHLMACAVRVVVSPLVISSCRLMLCAVRVWWIIVISSCAVWSVSMVCRSSVVHVSYCLVSCSSHLV